MHVTMKRIKEKKIKERQKWIHTFTLIVCATRGKREEDSQLMGLSERRRGRRTNRVEGKFFVRGKTCENCVTDTEIECHNSIYTEFSQCINGSGKKKREKKALREEEGKEKKK